jgi:hypothetical protein
MWPACRLTSKSPPEWDLCLASIVLPPAQERIKKLMERGFHKPGDVENAWDITSANSSLSLLRERRTPMSHHASGPNFGFPRGDARLDMTDLYAFTKPGDTVHWHDKITQFGNGPRV